MTTLQTLLKDVVEGSVMTDKASAAMSKVVTVINTLLLDKQHSLAVAQLNHFMWKDLDPAVHGRWMTREIDRYPPCANG